MRVCLVFGLLTLVLPRAVAETFTTADVLSRSYQSNCLDWKVVGACLWLYCKRGHCRVHTTLRIHHHLPDLVFTAYDHTGQSPWREMREIATRVPNLEKLLQGGSFPGEDLQEGRWLRFKEVDAVGHPAPLMENLFDVPYLCRSQARPLFPYYVSVFDAAAWRGAGAETTRPESLTPGLREIGDWPKNTWGAVFPRTGFVVQSEDVKAAAVVTQRVADIVTRPNQARVYTPFGYDGYREVQHGDVTATNRVACSRSGGRWQPDVRAPAPISSSRCDARAPLAQCQNPDLKSGSSRIERGRCYTQPQIAWLPPVHERNAQWQMISPRVQSQCAPFGTSAHDWAFDKTSSDGNYAWNLWRPYECCIPGKGRYIGHQNF